MMGSRAILQIILILQINIVDNKMAFKKESLLLTHIPLSLSFLSGNLF